MTNASKKNQLQGDERMGQRLSWNRPANDLYERTCNMALWLVNSSSSEWRDKLSNKLLYYCQYNSVFAHFLRAYYRLATRRPARRTRLETRTTRAARSSRTGRACSWWGTAAAPGSWSEIPPGNAMVKYIAWSNSYLNLSLHNRVTVACGVMMIVIKIGKLSVH